MNSSGDMDGKLVNIDNTEPNRQYYDETYKSGQRTRDLCTYTRQIKKA